jgi:DNA topoisomerase-2
MYLGSKTLETKEMYVLEGGKHTMREVSFVPGLLKIINEIIDNSVDEAERNNFIVGNKIDITIDEKRVIVSDNGNGIPVEYGEDEYGRKYYIPELCWSHARAGSNFDNDDDSVLRGTNGVGSFITLVFSKEFIGVTADGKNQLTLTSAGGDSKPIVEVKKSTKKGTTVSFVPNVEAFGLEYIDQTHINLIEQRLYYLSLFFPKIKFTLNGKKIQLQGTEFYKTFGENFELFNFGKYSFSIFPNEFDDFRHFSIVDGLTLNSGGTHIDYLMENIVSGLREKVSKKYKEIKNGDIKNKLQIVCLMKDLKAKKWDGQTKEKLDNPKTELRQYFGEIDFDKIVTKLFKNDDIMFPIIETHKIKEELKERKALQSMTEKVVKRVKVNKYVSAQKEKRYLFLGEGDSATNLIAKVIGREKSGFFPLKGKPLNVLEESAQKIRENVEFQNIMTIQNSEKYDSIVIATDADMDGISIRGLLLVFCQKFYPDMLLNGKICYLRTPIIVGIKGNKPVEFFIEMKDYVDFIRNNPKHGLTFDYKKGLGSNKPNELEAMFSEAGGFEKFIVPLEYNEGSKERMDLWFGSKNSDLRKSEVDKTIFDINAM